MKKYLFANLIGIPLHFFLIIILIFASIIGTANSNNWLASSATAITVFFFISLFPNLIIFIKYFDEKENISGFCISTVLLYFIYFIIINVVGYFIFH